MGVTLRPESDVNVHMYMFLGLAFLPFFVYAERDSFGIPYQGFKKIDLTKQDEQDSYLSKLIAIEIFQNLFTCAKKVRIDARKQIVQGKARKCAKETRKRKRELHEGTC